MAVDIDNKVLGAMDTKQRQSKLVFTMVLLGVCVIAMVVLLSIWFYRDKGSHVSFSDWAPLKPIKAEKNAFHFAIASMISVEETWVTYKELVDYVASAIGDKVSLILRPSYSEVRTLLENHKVDLAFVCTGTYLVCSETGAAELLVVPEFKNGIKYRCLFIVRADSMMNNIESRELSLRVISAESSTQVVTIVQFMRSLDVLLMVRV
jgi:phosphonate transport system substrate-binding protein